MWPFRSTRDRIEELRELRRPAPETSWPWPRPENNLVPPEHAGARVSADVSTFEVEVRWVDQTGAVLFGVALSRQQTASHIAALTRALGALGPEPTDVAVDITDEANGKEADDVG